VDATELGMWTTRSVFFPTLTLPVPRWGYSAKNTGDNASLLLGFSRMLDAHDGGWFLALIIVCQ